VATAPIPGVNTNNFPLCGSIKCLDIDFFVDVVLISSKDRLFSGYYREEKE
jgi:hypothetical protein